MPYYNKAVGKFNRYDLASWGVLALIVILSVSRLNYLPQYIDAYYHLSCANAFIKSGGWMGIDWWNYAPVGRPNLYPPLYHLLLVVLKKIGLSGFNAVCLTEVAAAPALFFVIWFVFRKIVSSLFSFFLILLLSSFFAFYSSVTANIPATIALIFGFLSWFSFWRGKEISALVFLALAFYTHAGIPWIFVFSYLALLLARNLFKPAVKVILGSVCLAFPLLWHQINYHNFVVFSVLGESKYAHYSLIILAAATAGILFSLKGKKEAYRYLFFGFLLGSWIIFFKYRYRFFSAQGILGFAFFGAFFLSQFTKWLKHRFKKRIYWFTFSLLVLYIFFMHSSIDLSDGKQKFNLFNSTYYNLISGKFSQLLEFNTLFYPRYYGPLIALIKENSKKNDIISSNLRITAGMCSALSNRPTSSALLEEVHPFGEVRLYQPAKFIIMVKPQEKYWQRLIKKNQWLKVYDNDIAAVFFNPAYKRGYKPLKAAVSFPFIAAVFLLAAVVLLVDNLRKHRNFTLELISREDKIKTL